MVKKLTALISFILIVTGIVAYKSSAIVTYQFAPTADTKGVTCSTSTVTSIPYIYSHRKLVRVTNTDSSNPVYIGFRNNITTSGDNAGEKVYAGSSKEYEISSNVQMYCLAVTTAVEVNVYENAY